MPHAIDAPPAKFVNGYADGGELVLLYRDPAGRMLKQVRRAEWSSFYRRGELTDDVLRDLRNSSFVVGIAEEGEWVRVRWQAAEWRKKAHERDGFFAQLGVTAYEADVSEVRRFFADTGALVAAPRRVYLDIETDSRVPAAAARQGKARVLCWALADENERVVATSVLTDDTDGLEKTLLEQLWLALEPYDQVCAWFGDGFDFPIVKERSLRMGASYGPRGRDPRRWLWMDQMELYERTNKNASESGEEKVSLKLQDVAMARLGRGKVEFDATKAWDEWEAGGERRQRLVDYCVGDTLLLPAIEKKTGHLAINDSVCEVCHLFADTRSANPTEYVDGFLLRMAAERATHLPTRAFFTEEERRKFAGAWVMEPRVKGIAKDVHVCDFSGMYPSIILSWNMSPETKSDVPVNGPIPEGFCRSPSTGVGFRLEPEGMIPAMVRVLGELRKQWTKKQASFPPGTPEWQDAGRKSMAYKVIRNSVYGVIGSPFYRCFDRSVAESITQNGVWLIQKTIHAAEQRGIVPIYGDTDSTFVQGVTREAFGEFVAWCNTDLYPAAVAAQGCRENHIEIAYEKEFERVVLVTAKRYAGVFRHYKWTASCACDTAKGEPGAIDVRTMRCRDCGVVWPALPPPRGKPEIKGLEYKRGDAALLARRLQWEAVGILLTKRSESVDDFVPLIERYRTHLLDEPLPPAEVVVSESLGKPLREYVTKPKKDGTPSAEQAHVRIARLLKERGEQIGEGSRISYFVVDASVTPQKVAPAADYVGECDRFYLWEKLVWPPTMRLLAAAFPDHDWAAYDRVRPSKKSTAGQGSLFAEPKRKGVRKRNETAGLFDPPPPPPADAVVAAPKIVEPFVVELAEGNARQLIAVSDVLRGYPGERPVILRFVGLRGTSEQGVPMRVSRSPELVAAVERAKESA